MSGTEVAPLVHSLDRTGFTTWFMWAMVKFIFSFHHLDLKRRFCRTCKPDGHQAGPLPGELEALSSILLLTDTPEALDVFLVGFLESWSPK